MNTHTHTHKHTLNGVLAVLSKMLKILTMLKEEEVSALSGYMGKEGGAFARAEGC